MNNLLAILILTIYFVVSGVSGLLISVYSKFPDEIKRKILHMIGFMSFFIFIFAFQDWYISVITSLVIGIVSFITILFIERKYPKIISLFKERFPGEIKYTILMVFIVFALVITISWGCLYNSFIGLLAILGWGFGDMAASLVGSRFGKHLYSFKAVSKKTFEGSFACFIAVSLSSILILYIYSFPILITILFGLAIGLVGSLIELFSPNGYDTIFMPIGITLFCLILYAL